MKVITAKKIRDCVAGLCVKANRMLREDVAGALTAAYRRESSARARSILDAVIRNAQAARTEKLAICQDTGMPIVFVEWGQNLAISGGLTQAIQQGVALGYRQGSLRNSIIQDPLARGKPGFGPAVIHIDAVTGSRLKLTVLPKGFGCENKSALKCFKPTADINEVKKFIIETVKNAGPDACPPYCIGVGIGGTADYASLLAKKALLRKIGSKTSALEREVLAQVNRLNIGPMGLGGATTALAVHIRTYPTHIAGLPVAVNISCHALRSATATL